MEVADGAIIPPQPPQDPLVRRGIEIAEQDGGIFLRFQEPSAQRGGVFSLGERQTEMGGENGQMLPPGEIKRAAENGAALYPVRYPAVHDGIRDRNHLGRGDRIARYQSVAVWLRAADIDRPPEYVVEAEKAADRVRLRRVFRRQTRTAHLVQPADVRAHPTDHLRSPGKINHRPLLRPPKRVIHPVKDVVRHNTKFHKPVILSKCKINAKAKKIPQKSRPPNAPKNYIQQSLPVEGGSHREPLANDLLMPRTEPNW